MIDVVSKTAEISYPYSQEASAQSTIFIVCACRSGKVAVNSAAVKDQAVRGADVFGNRCIVVLIGAHRKDSGDGACWEVVINGGGIRTGLDVLGGSTGCRTTGELLVTSMDADGTKDGYDNELGTAIASFQHSVDCFRGCRRAVSSEGCDLGGHADTVLAASIFHFACSIFEVKSYLRHCGILCGLRKGCRMNTSDGIEFGENGLLPAIVQGARVANPNAGLHEPDSRLTLETGHLPYSRSRCNCNKEKHQETSSS